MKTFKLHALRGLVILPAVALGAWLMLTNGASSLQWGQQLGAWAVFGILTGLAKATARRIAPRIWSVLLLMLLCSAFLGPEAGGAHRWLKLGPLNVNAALLVLPGLLVSLSREKAPHAFLLVGAAILSFQPDGAQLAAFAAGALPLLWQHRHEKLLSGLTLAAFGMLLLGCWNTPVTLEPEAYAEGILALMGPLQPLGWCALALVPLAFAVKKHWSLALYYAVTLLFALTGQHPVPFMGLGMSPIVGYWLAGMLG